MGAHIVFWTAENEADLKKWVEEGLSASQIAVRLKVTRNTVMGKISRMGLRLKGAINDASTSRNAHARRKRRETHSSTFNEALTYQSTKRLQQARAGELHGEAVELKTGMVEGSEPCSIMDLCSARCRWPLSGAEPWTFCGGRISGDGPYCAGHAAIAYTQPKTSQKEFARGLRRFA